MNKYARFALLIAVIVGTLAWLAYSGVSDTSTYYKTVAEVQQMGHEAQVKQLRVAGDVIGDTIERNGRRVTFTLKQTADGKTNTLPVVYEAVEPLPDTFRDGAQALAEGHMGPNGVFQATKIQAKCASKYEAKPGDLNKPMSSTSSSPRAAM